MFLAAGGWRRRWRWRRRRRRWWKWRWRGRKEGPGCSCCCCSWIRRRLVLLLMRWRNWRSGWRPRPSPHLFPSYSVLNFFFYFFCRRFFNWIQRSIISTFDQLDGVAVLQPSCNPEKQKDQMKFIFNSNMHYLSTTGYYYKKLAISHLLGVVGWLLTTQRRIFLLPKSSVHVVVIGNENYTHTERRRRKREKWWANEEREKKKRMKIG